MSTHKTFAHDYRLRPYHSPEGVDESKAPDDWRFRYEYEYEMRAPAKLACRKLGVSQFGYCQAYKGVLPSKTYIVPVAP